jgi:hypothetical protein
MKKQTLTISAILSFLLALSAVASPSASIPDVAVMSGRDDGRYDVYCKNGNHEVVSDLDISLNNVCPNRTSSEPTLILSMQRREDGSFDIVCRDLKKIVATEAEILQGGVCDPEAPKLALEPGFYKVVSGHMSYYSHTVTTTQENGSLKEVQLRLENGWNCRMSCEGATCKGISGSSTCTGYTLQVLSPVKYQFSGSPGVGIFEKQ